ncbi:HAMP domain-containing sensor histidine kinase [Rummeliibacillus pycnus]|uniref:HAMP domain-containing sensor histidine kinase n=1 Tax=Rummeliibacillus pycnus TaxID=101070 RepID=UPI003D2C9A81
MKINKVIFQSNTIMVLLPLILLFIVGGTLVSIFNEDYIDNRIKKVQLNKDVYEIQTLFNNMKIPNTDWQGISKEVSKYGYHLYVAKDQKKVYSNLKNHESEYIDGLRKQKKGQVNAVYHWDYATIVRKEFDSNGSHYDLITINVKKNSFWTILEHGGLETIFGMYFVIGVVAIIIIIVISQLFTRRLVKKVTNPINHLMDGEKRIEAGNLREPIVYQGIEEFEILCHAFNQMQAHLLEERERNEKYENARTDMISGISHDLRTPLTSVKGYIKGLLDGIAKTPEKQHQYLTIAYKKAGDMDVLLQRLFDFSKLETGNMPFVKNRLDFELFLEQFVGEIRDDLANKQVKVSLFTTNEEHNVEIDTVLIKRVLINIIENSLKYAESEHLQISFTLSKINRLEVLEIKDNGKGVDEGKLSHLFEQFYRGDESRNSKNEGNGLGLYISKYIIEEHGGTISAANQDGLKITITLPTIY